MPNSAVKLENLKITPYSVHLYVPPILWKGDRIGHIGERDVFFFVLEGECFLSVDAQSYIVKKGQLAFLPKGKMRMYTQASENFSMYEMRFKAELNDNENLMEVLDLTEQNFVVDVENMDEFITKSLNGQSWAAKASVVFYWSMVAYRAEWRYGIYAHRTALMDVGHMAENLYLACTGIGLGCCAIASFSDELCNQIFKLDGEEEFTVYAMPVGTVRNCDKAAEQSFYSFVDEENL